MSLFEVKNISFSYGEHLIFSDISFSIDKGDVLCILGPNGTGKTTLIKCLNGLNDINSGEILINGKNIQKLSFKEISKHIGYIPQSHIPSFPFKVLDVVMMGRAPYLNLSSTPNDEDVEIALNALKVLSIDHLKDKEYTNLSGGERQLVFIARALTQDSKIIVMDEPLSALDFGNQQRLFRLLLELKRKGKTIIFTTHNPNHLTEINAAIYAMKNGTINKIEELTVDSLNDIYDDEFTLKDGYFNFKI